MIYTNKLIELGILPEVAESGVSKISLVEDPAIEADFLYFKKEEFVTPNAGESKDEFLGRCIPILIGEGKDEDQAAAICYSYLEEFAEDLPHYTEDRKLWTGPTHKDAEGRLMTGEVHTADSEYLYHLDQFDFPKDTCWPGYEPIGSKPGKGGRLVPNCVPVKAEVQKIKCVSCGWSWDLVDGGEDPYVCHKCGADNSSYNFESYNDYPESAKAAAKRALEFRDKNPDINCGTAVGWARANQLSKGENISEETIARMASFARHLQYKDVPYTQGCGGLMVDAWGGQAGIEWASNKLTEIRGKDFGIDTSSLPPYVDEIPRKDEVETPQPDWSWKFSDEFLIALEKLGSELGFTEDQVEVVDAHKFADARAIKGSEYTPARQHTSADPEEFVWKFASSRVSTSGSRGFCRTMMSLNRYYSREEVTLLNNLNTEFGPGGGSDYSIFMYKGGSNCQHFWRKYSVKREGSRLKVLPVDIDASYEERMAATAPRTLTGRGFLKSPQNALPGLSGKSEFSSILKFADEEQRILVGPCMIPDMEIPRIDDNGQPYSVVFSAETIAEIAKKYMKEARTNDVNQDHEENKDAGTYVFETWLIEDTETDKANTIYGFNYPKGTWMVKMQVEDAVVWKRVKAGELKGFSVEGLFSDMEEIEAQRKYTKIKKILKG